MSALIKIDFVSLRKTLLLIVAFTICLCGYGIYRNRVYLVAPVCAYLSLILISISCMTDSKSRYQQYIFSMPVSTRAYVYSKLIYAVIFGIVGSVLTLLSLIFNGKINTEISFIIALAVFVFIIFLSVLQLLFFIKYGAEKGKLIMGITYILFFGAITLLKEHSLWMKGIYNSIITASPVFLGIAVILITTVTIGIIIEFSIKIMNAKEY